MISENHSRPASRCLHRQTRKQLRGQYAHQICTRRQQPALPARGARGITAKIEPPEDWTDPVEDVEVDVPRVVSPSPVEGREQPPALREESRSRACSPGEPPG